MEYSDLIAVTGLPGLFELINSKGDGAIVRSLADKQTKFISNRVHNFTHLESIEIYTIRENVNLVEVLNAMDQSAVSLPNEKKPDEVKKYFEKVYPNMDFDRVYASDQKKMIKWFDILKKNNIEMVISEEEEEEEDTAEEAPAPEKKPTPPKPAPKKEKQAAKKAAAKKEEKEKPAKKAAPKKKAAKKTTTKKAAKKK